MALNFGKLNFSTSFNPTSAFPLDARSYFESYELAAAAAASAVPAGGDSSAYYYGQTLVVVEANKASFYIIQPNGTLSAVTGSNGSTSITVNPALFEYDENNNLSLIGFNEAEVGMFFTKGANGALVWTKPIDAYTKAETDTQIATALASASRMKRKIVADEKEIEEYIQNNSDAEQYIFMVPTGLEESGNKYDEYIVFSVTDDDNVTTQYYEKIGSWEVDLSQYAKVDEVEAALESKVSIAEGQRLMMEIEGQKLAGIEEGAQKNIIDSISTDFIIDTANNNQLQLVPITIAKVTGLQDALNGKVDAQEGYGLVSPTDREKLNKLVIGESGNLEISSSVDVSKVIGLSEWITAQAGTLEGLSENNLDDELYNKLYNSLYITSVKTDELAVSTEGQLSLVAVDMSKITGLQTALTNKADVDVLESAIENLSAQMNNYVLKTTYDADIAEIKDVLTWKEL